MMQKTMIFDLGNVVINFNPKDFLATHFFNKKVERILYRSVFASAEWLELDQGILSWYDASKIFMRRGQKEGIALEMQGLLDTWTDMLSPIHDTNILLQHLAKKGYPLYYLSNISFHALNALSKNDFWHFFNGGVASCEVGLIKPDPTIYHLLLEKYNLNAQECIFIDDVEENIRSAIQCGMQGILCTDPAELKKSFYKSNIFKG